MSQQTIVLAAGCFWGIQAVFDQLPGVLSTRVGYIGGHTSNPTYNEVCRDHTGHAEAVDIKFDDQQISLEHLLNIFWQCHNPTQINSQGPDTGSQYRSEIFYHSEEQRVTAQSSKQALEKSSEYTDPIATKITKVTHFFPAEDYHQHYLKKNPQAACHIPQNLATTKRSNPE